MDTILNAIEVRVLGSLIEKQITTPDYYPLTLNALTNACNQKNNRDPAVSFDERTVVRGLESLREKKLVAMMTGSGVRVPKYKHNLTETYNLNPQEVAVLCLLMLRGPQTTGEIRGRSAPLGKFESLADVESAVARLCSLEGRVSFVCKLPRLAGQKEARYMHLFCGEPDVEEDARIPSPEPATLQVQAENERISKLEEEVNGLQQTMKELKKMFLDFQKQFE